MQPGTDEGSETRFQHPLEKYAEEIATYRQLRGLPGSSAAIVVALADYVIELEEILVDCHALADKLLGEYKERLDELEAEA